MLSEYEGVTTSISVADGKGNMRTLSNVAALKDKKTGRVWVEPEEVERATFRDLAAELGIKPRQVPLILLFHAQPGVFQRGFLVNKYKLNKMLFYQWKMLEKMGLGEGFIHDEFIPEKNGPVPKSLFEDLDDLRDKGLIKLSGGKKERKPVEAVLTLEGEHLATKTWCSVAEPYREISTDVKNMIFPLDPKTVKEKVHAEYPEFRKVYVEEDHE